MYVEFCLETQHGKQESQPEGKGKKGETVFKGKVQQIKLAIAICVAVFYNQLSENIHEASSTRVTTLEGICKSLVYSKVNSVRLQGIGEKKSDTCNRLYVIA